MKTTCKLCGIDIKEYNDNCKACRNRKRYHENEKLRKESIKRTLLRQEKLINQGICPACEKNMILQNKTRCEECLNKIKNNANNRKQELLNKGLCISCGKEKVIEGKNFCEKCLTRRRKRSQEYIDYLIKEGRCLHCRQKKELFGKTICKECADKQRIKANNGLESRYYIYFRPFKLNINTHLIKRLKWRLVRLEYDRERSIIKIIPSDDEQYSTLFEHIIDIKNFRKQFEIKKVGKFEAIYNKIDNTIYINLD